MALNSQVKRLGRVRSSVRADMWPPPPMLPEAFVRKFPELKTYNDDMRRWAERVRNMMITDGTS